ncbi:MAG: metallophosphoesterase [Planctomycetota bacterium]
MSRADRIVVLSDTHLSTAGRGAGSAAALRPLWDGADECVINGDVAEIADEKLRGPAARQVVELLEYAEADGVKLTFISGNHDPLLTDRRYLRLAGGEVFLTHGDILHPAISPWTDHAKHLQQLHADAVLSLDPAKAREMDHRLAACQHASVIHWDHPRPRNLSRRSRYPRVRRRAETALKAAKALYYWSTIPRRAMGFARRFAPESRFFVFGHIHRAGVWVDRSAEAVEQVGRLAGAARPIPGGGRVIINTGAYQTPRNPRAVVIEGDRLSVWPVMYDLAGHRFGTKAIAEFGLKTAVTAARAEGAEGRGGAAA